MSSKTRSGETSKEQFRMVRALLPDTPKPPPQKKINLNYGFQFFTAFSCFSVFTVFFVIFGPIGPAFGKFGNSIPTLAGQELIQRVCIGQRRPCIHRGMGGRSWGDAAGPVQKGHKVWWRAGFQIKVQYNVTGKSLAES